MVGGAVHDAGRLQVGARDAVQIASVVEHVASRVEQLLVDVGLCLNTGARTSEFGHDLVDVGFVAGIVDLGHLVVEGVGHTLDFLGLDLAVRGEPANVLGIGQVGRTGKRNRADGRQQQCGDGKRFH